MKTHPRPKRTFLAVFALLAGMAACGAAAFAQEAGPAGAPAGKDANAYFKSQKRGLWTGLKENVNVSTGETVDVELGDKLVAKDRPLIVKAGGFVFGLGPYTVVSIRAEEEDGAVKPIIDLLLGEALVLEPGPVDYEVDLPKMKASCSGKSYFYLDAEGFSLGANLGGTLTLHSNEDGAEIIRLPQGNQADFTAAGQVFEAYEIDPADLGFLTSSQLVENALQMAVVLPDVLPGLARVFEKWSIEKINMLEDGMTADPEPAAGKAEAGDGEDMGAAFKAEGGATAKRLSFGATVKVTTAGGESPIQLSEIAINGRKASGSSHAMKASELEDGNIVVTAVADVPASERENWSVGWAVEEEIQLSPSLEKIRMTYKPTDETERPSLSGATIGNFTSDDFSDLRLIDKSHLAGGRLEAKGFAVRLGEDMELSGKLVARNKGGDVFDIQELSVILNTAGVERVEVSFDNGSSFETANLPKESNQFVYQFSPGEDELYGAVVRAFDYFGNESEEQLDPYRFYFTGGTYADLIRARFEEMMQGFQDEDRSTLLRYASGEFNTSIERLEDVNEFENSIEERFRCCPANIAYAISEVVASSDGSQGDVIFNWANRDAMSAGQRSDLWRYVFEEGAYKLYEVNDPKTFLKPSSEPERIEIELGDDTLTADGVDSTLVTVRLIDFAGSIVADGTPVEFSATEGAIFPTNAETMDGEASATFTVGKNPGTAVVTVISGTVEETAEITLTPIEAPGPPD